MAVLFDSGDFESFALEERANLSRLVTLNLDRPITDGPATAARLT